MILIVTLTEQIILNWQNVNHSKEILMLDFETDYATWSRSKLDAHPNSSNFDAIPIQNPNALNDDELTKIKNACEQNNFALYCLSQPPLADKDSIRSMSYRLGMRELDQNLCADNNSISSLQVMNLGRSRGYIPYSEKALNWHTDGYYNEHHEYIRSFLLHCIQKAPTGGENIIINHELIYIHLFEEDPNLVTALMQQDALTIPANIENGKEVRPAQSGPVFYRDSQTNALQMRYTARERSIFWKDDPLVQRAVNLIKDFLKNDEYIIRYTLNPGEGLVCNNILHGRSAFTNGNIPEQQRLMYRIRSYNRLFSGQ